jgi:hypothetical protein
VERIYCEAIWMREINRVANQQPVTIGRAHIQPYPPAPIVRTELERGSQVVILNCGIRNRQFRSIRGQLQVGSSGVRDVYR